MEKKFKVSNLVDNQVSINLMGLNNKVIAIAGKGIGYLTEEELYYLRTTSKIFEKGFLKVLDTTGLDIEFPNTPNALTDDDIEKILKKTQSQIEALLKDIDNVIVVKKILDKSKEMDKGIKIVEVIQSRFDELSM